MRQVCWPAGPEKLESAENNSRLYSAFYIYIFQIPLIHSNYTVVILPREIINKPSAFMSNAVLMAQATEKTSAQRRGNTAELLGAMAFVVIFAVGNYLVPFSPKAVHVWADLFWTLGALIAALRCLVLARTLQGPVRTAWRLFGLGCGAWFAGMLVWDYQELWLGEFTPFPGLSDLGYYLFAILFGAGLVFIAGQRMHAPLTLLEICQFGIFLSCIVLAHLVIFAPVLLAGEFSSQYVVSALAYPVLYMTLLAYGVAMLWRMDRSAQGTLRLIVPAVAAHALTNSLYAYALLDHNYQAGNYLDILWVIGFALIYQAAVRQQASAGQVVAEDGRTADPYARARLTPVISIGLTIAVVIAFRQRLTPEIYPWLLPPVLLLLLFVALREWAGGTLEAGLTRAIRASEEQLRRIFDISPVMIALTRRGDGTFIDVNEAFVVNTGYSRDELIGKSAVDLGIWNRPEDRERLLGQLQVEGTVRGLDVRICTKSGEARDILASVARIAIGDEECLLSIALDVTERQRTAEEMRKLARALEQSGDMVLITDHEGLIEYINPAFERITGYTSAEVIGRRSNILRSGMQGPEFYRTLWERILRGETFSEIFINRARDGAIFYEQKTITPLRNAAGEITNFVATGRDISERIKTEERLQYLAGHDTLTTLPNRAQLLDHLQATLAAARAHTRQLAVLFLDLDRFKNINDSLGHDAGDRLLQDLANRLRNHLRAHDRIARFGGDEFVVVMDNIASVNDAGILASRLIESLIEPFEIAGSRLHVSVSVGISLFPDDGEDSGSLLKHADAAMYRAKEMGGNRYQFYSADIGAHARRRLTLENHLRRALERGEFVLHYQPQVDGRSGRILGCEALLRWQHADQGLVPPADFIPLLEETGLIVPVGRWVLETACAQLGLWRRSGYDSLAMAVNISSQQIHEVGLQELVAHLLGRYDIVPDQLELEITESTLMQHIPNTADTLSALVGLGVRIALDDFGTGYSSLSYLHRFPIDTLKVDRAFVSNIPGPADDTAIVEAIIALARSLHLRVIAEGVETQVQREFLNGLGCDVMQGYLFSRPVTADAFAQLLAKADPWPALASMPSALAASGARSNSRRGY